MISGNLVGRTHLTEKLLDTLIHVVIGVVELRNNAPRLLYQRIRHDGG